MLLNQIHYRITTVALVRLNILHKKVSRLNNLKILFASSLHTTECATITILLSIYKRQVLNHISQHTWVLKSLNASKALMT